jgi:hypothetical protein
MMWGEMSFQLVTFAGGLVSSLNLINQVFLRVFAGVSLHCRRLVPAVGPPWPKTISMPGSCQNEFEQG